MPFQNHTWTSQITTFVVSGSTKDVLNGTYSKSYDTYTNGTGTFKKNSAGFWALYNGQTQQYVQNSITQQPYTGQYIGLLLNSNTRKQAFTVGQGRQAAIISVIIYNDTSDIAQYNSIILNDGQSDVFNYSLRVAPYSTVVMDNKILVPSTYSVSFQTSNNNVKFSISVSQDKVR